MDAHIPDDELARYSYDPESFPPERQAQIQWHLAGCTECDAHFDFYTVLDEDLKDPGVWQPGDASGLMLMRAYRLRCEAEDAEADRLLEPYFANPTRAAFADIRKRREFRTGGVVRRLNAQANAMVADSPVAALAFADLAQSIADLLPDNTYPREIVNELRGTAWKECANALLRLGRFEDALASLRRAESSYVLLTSPTHGLAAVELVRAAVYYQRGELGDAAFHAERAELQYGYLGLPTRQAKATLLRGEIKYEALEYAEAAAIFQGLMSYGEEVGDPAWIARGAYCRGACELESGNIAHAAMLFHTALVIFRDIGPLTERISTEWGLARVVLHGGKASEAAHRLRDIIARFEKLGMFSDAALAGVDLSEALLFLGRYDEIVKVAAHAFTVLKDAGILTSALTALAYLKEAAAKEQLRPADLTAVRQFLRKVERSPDLLFLPPPAASD